MDALRTPSAEAVRLELQSVLGSEVFATAARSRRFLSWVTEKTLAGESDGIKEFVVGLEVFDRAGDFDPRTDTIVRVEAGKLRKRLDEYYAGQGAGSALRITLPKGSYVPGFQVLAQNEVLAQTATVAAVPAPPKVHSWWKYAAGGCVFLFAIAAGSIYWRTSAPPAEPTVAVLPFLNFSSDPANEYFADGLTEDLTDALARLGGMRVASRTSAFTFKGKRPDIHEVGAKLQARSWWKAAFAKKVRGSRSARNWCERATDTMCGPIRLSAI